MRGMARPLEGTLPEERWFPPHPMTPRTAALEAATPSQFARAIGRAAPSQARPDLEHAVEAELARRPPSRTPFPEPIDIAPPTSVSPAPAPTSVSPTRVSPVMPPAAPLANVPRAPLARAQTGEARAAILPGNERATPLYFKSKLDDCKTDLLREALRATNGNRSEAARLLGLTREGMRKALIRAGFERGTPGLAPPIR